MILFNYWSHRKFQQQLKLLYCLFLQVQKHQVSSECFCISAFRHSSPAHQTKARKSAEKSFYGTYLCFPFIPSHCPPQLRFKCFMRDLGISPELSNLKSHGQVLLSTSRLMYHTAKEKMCLENFSLEANKTQAWMCSVNGSQLIPYCKCVLRSSEKRVMPEEMDLGFHPCFTVDLDIFLPRKRYRSGNIFPC